VRLDQAIERALAACREHHPCGDAVRTRLENGSILARQSDQVGGNERWQRSRKVPDDIETAGLAARGE
jgi:hypothetical protein